MTDTIISSGRLGNDSQETCLCIRHHYPCSLAVHVQLGFLASIEFFGLLSRRSGQRHISNHNPKVIDKRVDVI